MQAIIHFLIPVGHKNFTKILASLIFTSTLVSCDSSDNIPVQLISNNGTLTDTELEQQSNSQHLINDQLHQHMVFYFGFDLRSSPQEDAAQYLPFLKYLTKATGYEFKLKFTPKNSNSADQLGNNITQFAAVGATSYLYASSVYNVKSLVRGLNKENLAEYQSVFVVKPGSNIKNIHHIQGKRLAFGSQDSTQGHLIPRIMLSENNITLKDLKKYSYTGSHQSCAEAVIANKFDVCGMQDQLAKKLAAQGLIKIIHTSRYYPSSGIAANKTVPEETISKVTQALLNFKPKDKHKSGLHHWDRTEMPNGFVKAEESDYNNLKKWSLKLGFLVDSKE